MGQEISTSRFKQRDFSKFDANLRQETGLLHSWFQQNTFSKREHIAGLEVEAWLVDNRYQPAAENDRYLAALDDPMVVPELAKFNFELNVAPQPLKPIGLRALHEELDTVWQRCQQQAHALQLDAVMIGILPTISDAHLSMRNMSSMKRYKALNEQVMRARLGKPLHLHITGQENLQSQHLDVMLESAATSFQLHLQVPAENAARYFNAAIMLSAPMVAVNANSPFLFGKDLWDESRIPLFEQAVDVGGFAGAAQGPVKRVTFGSGYVRNSLFECFEDNLAHYPILLPIHEEDATEKLTHLRLHNGTIWRWNRPLIGFDEDQTPHLRVEHRVMAAGPSVTDQIANAAFYYGMSEWLVNNEADCESRLPFATAKNNFYNAARQSFQAQVDWLDGKRCSVQKLILDIMLEQAEWGLRRLSVAPDDIKRYLDIIEARATQLQHGAAWQRKFVARYGRDMAQLTRAYLERQRSGRPIHEWTL